MPGRGRRAPARCITRARARWLEGHESGCAPPVLLAATHERALELTEIDTLLAYAIATEELTRIDP